MLTAIRSQMPLHLIFPFQGPLHKAYFIIVLAGQQLSLTQLSELHEIALALKFKDYEDSNMKFGSDERLYLKAEQDFYYLNLYSSFFHLFPNLVNNYFMATIFGNRGEK